MRTWAPKGKTPVIQFHFNWTHVSVIAGLTRTNCLFRLHEGSIKKEEIVEFLKALKAPDLNDFIRKEGGEPVGSTPEELAAYFKREAAKYTKVINAANVTAD